MANQTDKRWGGYIPWFFRYRDYSGAGNFLVFFERASRRIYQFLIYNEPGIPNLPHFDSMLESKSHPDIPIHKKCPYCFWCFPCCIKCQKIILLHPRSGKKCRSSLIQGSRESDSRGLGETVAKMGHFTEPVGSTIPPAMKPVGNVTPAIDRETISEQYKQMVSQMNSTRRDRERNITDLYSCRDWEFWKY